MSIPFTVQQIGHYTVVEIRASSLQDVIDLETFGADLYRLVDEQDQRKIVLDFEPVQFLSSRAIGVLMALHKKLSALKGGRLVLCGVGPRLQELLRITQLDRILTIKPSQREAIAVNSI